MGRTDLWMKALPTVASEKDPNELHKVALELNEQRYALVEISLPSSKCQLLQEEIRLVDCPGFNDSFTMDKKLEDVCQDADVFVLVINAVSSLSEQDKKYFREVSNHRSKPNLFLLFNLWDKSSKYKPEVQEKTKQQHTSRAVEFLTKELQIVEETEAKDMIFFVSAKEVLKRRMGESVNKEECSYKAGFEERLEKFQEFESKVKDCVSETAVKTKFMTPAECGKDVISKIKPGLEQWIRAAECIIKEEERKLDLTLQKIKEMFMYLEDSKNTPTKESQLDCTLEEIIEEFVDVEDSQSTLTKESQLDCTLEEIIEEFVDVEDSQSTLTKERQLDWILEEIIERFIDLKKHSQNTLTKLEKRVKSTLRKQFAELHYTLAEVPLTFDPKKVDEYKNELNSFVIGKIIEELKNKILQEISRLNDGMKKVTHELYELYKQLTKECMEQNQHCEGNFNLPFLATGFNVTFDVDGLKIQHAMLITLLFWGGTTALKSLTEQALLAVIGSSWAGVKIAGVTIGAGTLLTVGSVSAGIGMFAGACSALCNLTLDNTEEACKQKYLQHVMAREKELTAAASSELCKQLEKEITEELRQLKEKAEDEFRKCVDLKKEKNKQDLKELTNLKTKLNAIDEKLSEFMDEFLKK